MSDFNFWLLFLSTALALNIAPGPDLLYILTKTIANGKRVGIASALGVCSGALFHVASASLGLSAILASSSLAFTIVKYVGVGYLLYLAYQSFRSAGTSLNITPTEAPKESAWKAYKQGVLVDILNPKVAIFFMAFLPQFIRDGQGTVPMQLLYLGLLVVAVAVIVEVIYVLLASKLTTKVRSNKRVSVLLDKIVGTVFVVLGLKLAVSSGT
ncbi:LysE family translocator [Moritella sp. F3]|uniref:LysE family translocator n=1 Tax=Moritella sp. F3 TaxID=2718882 RepID=UPI0018E1B3E9|nr:LysE family translocator [Moritella sp. F3]GIC76949.1 LysE family translocator [Moritella sp. F1]GIC80132.1 LysE family translocator [Moritella sp. F3]